MDSDALYYCIPMLTFKNDWLLLLSRSIFTAFHSLFQLHHDPPVLSPSAEPANRLLCGRTRPSSAGPIPLAASVKYCIFPSNLLSSRQDRCSSVGVVTVLQTAESLKRDSISFCSPKLPDQFWSPASVLPTQFTPAVKCPYD